mmetsp:Transcript_13600/g.21271  ORF Transcript_13600/g.21271 Transcript_13600/m.21271 type:complete len:92 (+) Transcript_13600:827-1102(+)
MLHQVQHFVKCENQFLSDCDRGRGFIMFLLDPSLETHDCLRYLPTKANPSFNEIGLKGKSETLANFNPNSEATLVCVHVPNLITIPTQAAI